MTTFAESTVVEFYEESLIEKKLVTPRKHSDRSGADRGQLFRLTDLGYKLCQFFLED